MHNTAGTRSGVSNPERSTEQREDRLGNEGQRDKVREPLLQDGGLLLTGEQIDARTAAEWGLVNTVVPGDKLREEARKLATRIAEASPVTLAIGKQAFYSQIDLDQPKAYAYAKEIMSMNSLAADGQEGISAFLGKRAACWTGR